MPSTGNTPTRRRLSVREQASADRRAQILDAAAAAFSDRGFNATSLRDVASRAQVSHTGLLYHYPDRNALLEALLDDRLRNVGDTYHLDPDDGRAFLRGLVAIAERDERDPSNLRLLTTLTVEAISSTHPAHQYFQRWHAEVQSLLTRAFNDLEQRGLFRASLSPNEAARHAAALREGTHVQWLLSDGSFGLADQVRSQLHLFAAVDL